ncbi:MAG: T9SS type A sorting domain-containing protein [Saprospiraceae bacterium]|nr:T9SS type A sorting domain-containing protein [Saprospiraceae bacterium]
MDTLSIGKTRLLSAFLFILFYLFTIQLSAQGGCTSIKFALSNPEPCLWRLNVDNSSECYPELRLLIDIGIYTSFTANMAAGWSVTKTSPTELLLTHSSGKVPIGVSSPVTFGLEPGSNPLLSILWGNSCMLLGCFFDIPITGCLIVADACILGVKYRECNQTVYSNQTPIPNFTINLFDNRGSIIGSTVTDSAGEYSFCDLAPGNYVVSEVNQTGWTPVFPSHGKYNVTLLQSEIATRNFGNCPTCSCDSIFTDIVPVVENEDTCSYAIIIQNNGGYCFTHFDLNISKGSISNFGVYEKAAKVVQLDSQNLRIILPDGSTHKDPIAVMAFACTAGADRKFTLTSYYNIGGNDVACERVFSYSCPLNYPNSCCPLGSTVGPELLPVNTNYNLGNFNVISSSIYSPPGSPLLSGFYTVAKSSEVPLANPLWMCTDHTTGSSTDKFAIFNDAGSLLPGGKLYLSGGLLQGGTQYSISAYVNNLTIPQFNLDDPIIEIWVIENVNTTPTFLKLLSVTVPEIPDQWLQICVDYTPPSTMPVQFYFGNASTSTNGNDIAIDDLSFRICSKIDSCICGPFDLQYSIGRGPLLPYDCGDTLLVPASTAILPIHFLSSFTCLGTNCPQTTVDLILTGPPGFIPITISDIQAIPNFIIPFTNATFAYTGIYTLTITGFCGGKPCPPCTIYFNADGYNCCNNQFDFELAISNAVTITLDSIKCKATLNIGNLPKCDSIGPIFWGDGTSSPGPFIAGTMPMHNYAGNGSYYISWTATEYDYSVIPRIKCFEKVFRDSITLNCDTCQCKSFSDMIFANFNWTTPRINVACGQNSQLLPCTRPGQNFWLHGFMNCNAQSCIKGLINWSVVIKNGPSIASGTANYFNPSNGHFDITLNPALFNPNVQYEIIVTGNCGNKLCKCIIAFSFTPCPCLCNLMTQAVSQGFFVSGNNLGCKRTIKPIALCANDKFTWLVTPSITPAPANTIGNNSQVFNFPNPGVYTVCMFVTRIDDNSVPCTDFYCRTVTVNCFPNPVFKLCETNAIKNGDFTEGRVEGHMDLSGGGKIDDWKLFPNNGEGLVYVSDSSGASDDGSIILEGNKNNFAGIWQQVDLAVDNFINIGFDIINYRLDSNLLGAEIVFRLQSDSTINAVNKMEILRKKVMKDEKDKNYLRNDFSINLQNNPDLKYLVLCLQNQSDSVMSIIGLDNIEMCTSKIPLSTYSEKPGQFRIYPNPSNGNFTIELQQAATADMKFRIIDLTGRNVLEKQTNLGTQIQNIDASKLASGFYFLQVVSKGKVLAVEKLMKQ